MLVQSFEPLLIDFLITRELCLCLVGVSLFLSLRFAFKRLIINFHRNLIKYSLKTGPIVSFLLAKNELIIQGNLKASNVRKEHVFFCHLIVILVFLFLDG